MKCQLQPCVKSVWSKNERKRIRLLLQDIRDALIIYQEGDTPEVLPMALRRVQALHRSLT